MKMPPVSPKLRELPFEAREFTWATFEDFFYAFLASQPTLLGAGENSAKVIRARPYGRKGDKQNGIDIRAVMDNREVWAFQCKHYPRSAWTRAMTQKAIEACTYEADRKFLLVTRELSEDCFEVVEARDDWELWDSRAISREFLNRVDPLKGAEILYRCFGPGWAEAFFDLPKSFPLIGAEARYFKLLGKGPAFHQRTKLIGRKEELKWLHAFAKARRTEVLLLPGRAGIGKSRLLLEFARTFNRKHRDATVLFVSDAESHASDYADALATAPKPLVLVFDDAHRLGEIRRVLFPVLVKEAGRGVKLVLALRPGPTHQIRRELVESGFDSAAIEEWAPMEPLSSNEAMKLAEAVLGQWESPRMRQLFTRISRESPLLAVMGAELWKGGRLKETDIRDTTEFRDKVLLAGFDRDIEPISERYGEETARTFGRLLALLGPVKLESGFFDGVGSFPGFSLRQDQLRELAAAFDKAGLLLETEAGFRIVPDLLSDQLAFEACYDSRGRATGFAVEVVRHFDPETFHRLIRHLAEAEWQAQVRLGSKDGLVGPVWEWFVDRFRGSTFYDRRKQLGQWTDIAHLQPERTIELAKLAISLTEAPPQDDNHLFRIRETEAHAYVLQGIPNLLKLLASSRREFTGRCFDLLWELGKDLAPPFLSALKASHPIHVMGEIAKAEHWKPLSISEEALEWVKRKALDGAMLGNANSPSFLLAELLNPLFKLVSEETWSSGEAFHFQTHLISISATSSIRDKALSLCGQLADQGDLSVALGIVEVIETAIQPTGFLFGAHPTAAVRNEWDQERKKALSLASLLLDRCDDPLLHFRVRRPLLRQMERSRVSSSSDYEAALRAIVESVPDNLGLRIARATLSYAHDEFPERYESEDRREITKQKWFEFLGQVADDFVRSYPDPPSFASELRRFVAHAREHGFTPNLVPLLSAVSESHPPFALDVTKHLIRERLPATGDWIRSLLYKATEGNSAVHLEICREAIETGVPDLVAGAIESLGWLRRFAPERTLPPAAWDLVLSVAHDAEEQIFRAFIAFLWISGNSLCELDWELVERLPEPPTEELRVAWIERVRDLLQESDPMLTSAVVRKVLSGAIATRDPGELFFEHTLHEIAERFPDEVFLFLHSRIRHAESRRDSEYRALPLEIGSFPFARIRENDEIASILDEWEARLLGDSKLSFDEKRLFRSVALLPELRAELLGTLLQKIRTSEQVWQFINLVKDDFNDAFVLHEPDLVRSLLAKAREVEGEENYRKTFGRLTSLPDPRGSINGEPDPEWTDLLAAAERLAHCYADDPDLGPFYLAIVEFERNWIESDRRDFLERRKRSID